MDVIMGDIPASHTTDLHTLHNLDPNSIYRAYASLVLALTHYMLPKGVTDWFGVGAGSLLVWSVRSAEAVRAIEDGFHKAVVSGGYRGGG